MANTVIKLDRYTNEPFSFDVVTVNISGSPITDADVDNVIYCKGFDGLYYKRQIPEQSDLSWWGAKGDGSDATALFRSAMTLSANLNKVLNVPVGDYTISSTIDMYKPLQMKSNGANLYFNQSGSTMIRFQGAISTGVAVTANITAGDTSINVASITELQGADYIYISTDENYNTIPGRDYKKGELVKVSSVSGTQVNLYTGVELNYDSSYTLLVKKLTMLKGVSMIGFNVKGLGGTSALLRFYECDGLSLSNNLVELAEVGIEIIYCTNANISNNDFNEIITDGTGYGLSIGGACRGVVVTGNSFIRCRHGMTTTGYTGVVMDVVVSNNQCYDMTSTALDTHGNARHVLFSDNVIRNCGRGISSRSPYCQISNNIIYNVDFGILALENGAINLAIYDNDIRLVSSTAIQISEVVDAVFTEISDYIIVKGNTIVYCPNGGGIALNNLKTRLADISYNDIMDTKYSAITINAAEIVSCFHNKIHSKISISGQYAINITGINDYSGGLPLGSQCNISDSDISQFYYGISVTNFDKLIERNNAINVTTTAQRRVFTSITTLYGVHLGSASFTGNGTTKTFSIAHGFFSAPHFVALTPTSSNGSSFFATKSSGNIVINFDTAPESALTFTFDWMAEVRFT